MLIAVIAFLEGTTYCALRSKRGQARKQQLFAGGTDLHRAIPFVDSHLKQRTAGATRFQKFIAFKLAAFCRRAVHTRAFEYMLLHLIRTAINKRRNTFLNITRRVSL